MTRTDRKILFTALAFFAVVIKGKNASDPHKAERVLKLAGLVESFCAEHVSSVLWAAADETGTLAVDEVIERHIGELRDKEETRLPEDRAALINIHDRLQQRKTRRMRREFYAFATEAQIADLVLKLLDEEINDDSDKALA
jgi:hypothetical protein